MNEQRAVTLFRAMADIGDDLIEEAETAPAHQKRPAVWRRWGALAACLCLIAAGAAAWRWMGQPGGTGGKGLADGSLSGRSEGAEPPSAGLTGDKPEAPEDSGPDGEDGCGSTLPGGITPVLRVGDTLYEWAGMSVRLFLDSGGSYCAMGDGSTYLPEGFREYGAFSGVTPEEPTADLQLQAGFDANGTVFISEEYPAVVYVLMNTDWFENSYVRFVSDALGDNELLSWQGRMYRFSYDYEVTPELEKLPEGCELIGNLRYVGDDAIPAGDLETNHRGDNYLKPVDGREVYAVPGDDSVVYVYEHQYWREGDYPAWRACYLWEQ